MRMFRQGKALPKLGGLAKAARNPVLIAYQERCPEGRIGRRPGCRQLLPVPGVGGPVEAAEQSAPLLVHPLQPEVSSVVGNRIAFHELQVSKSSLRTPGVGGQQKQRTARAAPCHPLQAFEQTNASPATADELSLVETCDRCKQACRLTQVILVQAPEFFVFRNASSMRNRRTRMTMSASISCPAADAASPLALPSSCRSRPIYLCKRMHESVSC